MSWNSVQHASLETNRFGDDDVKFGGGSTLSSRFGGLDLKNSMTLSGKGKNHPSFTIILRKQLPVSFVGDQDLLSNEAEDLFDVCKDTSTRSNVDLLRRHNFTLDYAWQIWMLDDKDTVCNDWNVKKQGAAVKTGKDFWLAYTQIYDMFDKLDFKNLMIFQDNIEPKWEDKSNIGGGRWYFDVSYNVRSEYSRRDCLIKQNYWTHCLEIVMSGCLGPQASLIVGMILHFKSCKYRVSLWIRSCDFNQVIQLGASLRKLLNLRCQLKFELHSTTTPTNSTNLGKTKILTENNIVVE